MSESSSHRSEPPRDLASPASRHLDRRSLLRAAGITSAAIAGAGALAACGRQDTPTAASAGVKNAPKAGNGSYVEVCAYNSAPYFYDHKLGMDMAGQLLGVKTEFTGPDQFDLPAMVNTLEQKVAEGPSGILVVGFDPSLHPGIEKALAKGIPVVTVDADLPDSKRLAFLGTGNYNAGVAGGTKLADVIGKPGKVVLMTITGQTNLTERVNGYKAALEAKGYQIVQIASTEGDPAKAASAATAALAKHPDLAGIGCVEAGGGRGVATALREGGKVGQVKVISMDRDPETLQAIEAGEIQASVAQKTAMMTFLGTLLLWQYQNAGVPITKDNKAAGITQFPKVVDTGAELITKDNVAAWKR